MRNFTIFHRRRPPHWFRAATATMNEHDTRRHGNDHFMETVAEFVDAWVEAKKDEIAVQQFWKVSRDKASVDQRQKRHVSG